MIKHEKDRAWIMVYTRCPQKDSYPEGLAASVHFAVSRDGTHFRALFQNYGMLFAKAQIDGLDRIDPRGVADPVLLSLKDGRFCVAARRVLEDGTEDESAGGRMLCWTTRDFCTFDEEVLWDRTQLLTLLEDGKGQEAGMAVRTRCQIGDEWVMGSVLSIDAALCDAVCRRWEKLRHVENLLPENPGIASDADLEDLCVEAVYSDGSRARKRVDWDVDFDAIGDAAGPGRRTICGQIRPQIEGFPLAKGYGDPVLFFWDGKWHFLATNDNRNDIGLYIRQADTIEGLFAPNVREHLILGVDEEKGFIQTFWAPEFHLIGKEAYILFAVGPKQWGPQCWLMKLKRGRNPIDPAAWEEPVRVVRKDGRPLCEDGITLDMTYLHAGGRSYMVWSYRRHIGTPLDTGSMLCIAAVEEKEPWRLLQDPVLLSRPLYGWENVSGTINNEGPHGFVYNGRVYLTYSGGAANGYTYALGLLTADENADLTDPRVWTKSKTPVLSFYSVKGHYGPGHNSFFEDEKGQLWIAYHAEERMDSNLRCDAVRRVHFGRDGEPVFDLDPKQDPAPGLRRVEVTVTIEPKET